jgi:hypothetical protein
MKVLAILVSVAGWPAVAFAQAAIAGSVQDSSGAALPGVTVEASSPALIEGVRLAVTDRSGRYRIDDLRPGTYRVRFTLEGWQPFAQDGVELPGTFTATVDAQLTLSRIEARVTVTGHLPVVDLHSVAHQTTISGDLVREIPTARSYNALLPLVPGVLTSVNDVVTGTAATAFPIHGGRTNESRLTLDGLNVGSPPSGNSATSYVLDAGEALSVTFTASGTLGETETGGLVMNIVSRSGGNTTQGSVFAGGSDQWLHASVDNVYDLSGTVGGPLVRSRLWYFANAHTGGSTKPSANVYYNLNAGDAGRWLYSPDLTRRAYSDRTFENGAGRLTWQISPRHKVSGFWDAQALCRRCTGATPGQAEPARVSPEAVGVLGRRLDVSQATWSSPISNRVLAEAGFGGTYFGVGNFERTPNPTRGLIRVLEQCANGCAANGNIPGIVYRSQDFSIAHTGSYLWKGSLAYATGTYRLKVGFQHTLMTDDRTWMTNDQNLTYRLNNGVPNQLTQSISPWVNNARVAWTGLFVQEEWRARRLTLQGALRFDRARSWFPAQQEGPSRFLPEAILVPATGGVDSYMDITPRLGAVMDLRGGGKTVVKFTLGKYLEGAGVSGIYANTNPTLRMPQTTSVFGTAGVTRAWTDANQNFVPDCNLGNPAAQDLRNSGGDVCGEMSNTNFGRNILTNNFDPHLLRGWGVRPSDWNLGLSLQHQLGARSSVDVLYTRRWFRGFTVIDNLALQPDDLTPFSITAPADPRLPGGGSYQVPGLYDVVPGKFGQVENLVTDSERFGRWSQRFSGVDVRVNLRVGRSVTLVAGTSTGQTVADSCAVRARLPELATTMTGTTAFGAGLNMSAVSPLSPYCRVAFGMLTQLRGLSSYVVPKLQIQMSAVFQSRPGPMLAANYVVANDVAAAALGRPLSGSAANVAVNILPPGAMYGDRINQIDLRFARLFTFGRARMTAAVDVYNALNSGVALSYDPTFVPGGPWLQPLAVMTPRFLKLTAEVRF